MPLKCSRKATEHWNVTSMKQLRLMIRSSLDSPLLLAQSPFSAEWAGWCWSSWWSKIISVVCCERRLLVGYLLNQTHLAIHPKTTWFGFGPWIHFILFFGHICLRPILLHELHMFSMCFIASLPVLRLTNMHVTLIENSSQWMCVNVCFVLWCEDMKRPGCHPACTL